MTVNTRSETTNITGRSAGEMVLADAADLSGSGVEAKSANAQSTTIYLHAAGAVDVTIEFSPDGGENWYEAPKSPVQFDSAGDNIVDVLFNHNRLRVSASNQTALTVQVREVI